VLHVLLSIKEDAGMATAPGSGFNAGDKKAT
jgi:hypothetical protein